MNPHSQPVSRQVIVRLLFAAACGWSAVAAAAETGGTNCASCVPDTSNEANGISIGRPKVFDNRTLALMLESMNEQLRTIQVVNQTTLASALGTQQGVSATESARSLAISSTPIPSVTREQTLTTGNATATGTALPDTAQDKTTTTQATVTPQIPTPDAAAAFSGFTPTYGQNAADLLSEQANLTYQIFNLRLILERSLSDRLLADKPRLQALLGFNVTIDPPRTAAESVAVVEITLRGPSATSPLELITMMPAEKTYNTAALSTKSNQFGAAVAVKSVQVGYGSRDRSQLFYLYRDVDTIAYERMESDGTLTLGWMFRPVLGRPSVSPGLRQLFAIVALPATDNAHGSDGMALDAQVKTYWKRYDQKTMTSFYRSGDATRTTNFLYGASLGLARPKIFNDRYTNRAAFSNIEVPSTSRYQNDLKARVNDVTWRLTGQKTALVTVTGENFFTGTAVVVGDKTYATPADGFVLKSSQAFDLLLPLDALGSGPGAVVGRYGSAASLYPEKSSAPPHNYCAEDEELTISRATTDPPNAGRRPIEIRIAPEKLMSPAVMHGPHAPLLFVNSNLVAPPYELVKEMTKYGEYRTVAIRAYPPKDSIPDEGAVVRLTFPFAPPSCSAVKLAGNPDKQFQITRISEKRMMLATTAAFGFARPPDDEAKVAKTPYCWKVLAGETAIAVPSKDCASKTSSESISDYAVILNSTKDIPDDLILVSPNTATIMLSVAKSESPKAAAVIEVTQNSAVWLDVPVGDASEVETVSADGIVLKFRAAGAAAPKKAKLLVELTRDVTSKVGDLDLTITSKDKKVSTARLKIVCPYCTNGES